MRNYLGHIIKDKDITRNTPPAGGQRSLQTWECTDEQGGKEGCAYAMRARDRHWGHTSFSLHFPSLMKMAVEKFEMAVPRDVIKLKTDSMYVC